MWIRLHKELSAMAVPWPQVLGLALLVVLVGQMTGAAVAVAVACWLLCFVVASRLFGIEFDERTLPRLLAQPLSRSRIWWEKMLVGAFLILVGSGAILSILWLVLSKLQLQGLEGTSKGWFVLMPLIALATGPTVSLWLRDSLRTLWVSMALPFAVQMVVLMLWVAVGGGVKGPHFAFILVPYCAVMLFLGYRRFLALEIATGGAGSGDFLAAGITKKDSGRPNTARQQAGAELKRRSLGVVRELVLKEVRLQQASLMVIGLTIATWVGIWILSFKADMPLASGGFLGDWLELLGAVPSVVLLTVVPALIGASALAAERQLGVTGWQLALPSSCRQQWYVKLAVCVLLTLLSALLSAGLGLNANFWLWDLPDPVRWFGAWPLLALTAGLFGSRHSRGPFQALGLSLIFGVAMAYVWHLVEFSSNVGIMLWPGTLAPPFILGHQPIGGLVDVAIVLVLWVLVWTVPRQEEWISGRKLERSRAVAGLAGLAFIAVIGQIWFFTWTTYSLGREIVIKDAEIEASGGPSSLEWLIKELELPTDRPEIENLVTIIDLDTFMTLNNALLRQGLTNEPFRPLHQPASRGMNLSVWVDGVPRQRLDQWYWLRARSGLLFSNFADKTMIEKATPRDALSSLRAFSIAPLWFQGKRQAQTARRVRQNVILDAVAAGHRMEQLHSWHPESFEDSVERGLEFLRPGALWWTGIRDMEGGE